MAHAGGRWPVIYGACVDGPHKLAPSELDGPHERTETSWNKFVVDPLRLSNVSCYLLLVCALEISLCDAFGCDPVAWFARNAQTCQIAVTTAI